jgi:hypothetical protein
MVVLSILASIAAVGVICCLLFYLVVYALPLFAGVTVGTWACGTGAGGLVESQSGLSPASPPSLPSISCSYSPGRSGCGS